MQTIYKNGYCAGHYLFPCKFLTIFIISYQCIKEAPYG